MAIKKWIGGDGNYGTAGNWIPSGVPAANDTVRLVPGFGGPITAGLAQSAVSLTAFIVEAGFPYAIATSAGYLEITTGRFEFAGGGESWIDLKASAVSPQVFATAAAAAGRRGLYLLGTAISVLNVVGGQVGLAVNAGETSTATTARVEQANADLWLGAGLSLTSFQQHAGLARLRCAATTLDVLAGQLTTEEIGTITTLNLLGGIVIANSTGTVTTANLKGGLLDTLQSGAARTFSTINLYRSGQLRLNKEAVTVTMLVLQETGILSASQAL